MACYTFQVSWRSIRHSDNIKVITPIIWEAAVLVLLTRRIYDLCYGDARRWYYIHTKFHENQFRILHNIKGYYLNNLRGCNVGITDEQDIWSKRLRWAEVIYVPNFTNIVSPIQYLILGIHTHRQLGGLLSLLLFYFIYTQNLRKFTKSVHLIRYSNLRHSGL
jgi:hypothetical protein